MYIYLFTHLVFTLASCCGGFDLGDATSAALVFIPLGRCLCAFKKKRLRETRLFFSSWLKPTRMTMNKVTLHDGWSYSVPCGSLLAAVHFISLANHLTSYTACTITSFGSLFYHSNGPAESLLLADGKQALSKYHSWIRREIISRSVIIHSIQSRMLQSRPSERMSTVATVSLKFKPSVWRGIFQHLKLVSY